MLRQHCQTFFSGSALLFTTYCLCTLLLSHFPMWTSNLKKKRLLSEIIFGWPESTDRSILISWSFKVLLLCFWTDFFFVPAVVCNFISFIQHQALPSSICLLCSKQVFVALYWNQRTWDFCRTTCLGALRNLNFCSNWCYRTKKFQRKES